MTQFEFWIVGIIVAGLTAVVWYSVQRLISKIDELIVSVNRLSENYLVQQSQISGILNNIKDVLSRLNDHGKRLRDIEIKRAKCKNCNE